ncbi:MAG TPA: VOC family protein [Stellaceae bacterium]|nr:VOC family protein [Stellaceae bacterium]
MRNGIAGIDHVIIGVRDLEAARESWSRLGFSPTPRGRHIGQGTGNYCIMFGPNYLELLGVVDPAEGAHRLARFLAEREGPMGLAFAPAGSPEAVREALLRRGCHPSEPRPLGRRIELPEGDAIPRFSLLALPPEETPGLDSFVCCHLTPELMRRPEWLAHANGVSALNAIHVLVADTAPLLPAYDRLLGMPQVTTTDAVALVHAGGQRIVFSTPDDFLTMHPGLALALDMPLPAIAALELAVGRLRQTADYLASRGIAFDEMPHRSLAVGPGEATGAILIFSEE